MTALIRELHQTRVGRLRLLHLILAGLLLVAIAASVLGAARPSPRELTLIARDMAFYLPGDATPNPTLRFRAGEAVELTLRNEDPGMAHDLAVDALGFQSETLRRGGSSTRFTLRLPDEAGRHDYLCSYHPVLMRGTLLVE